MPSTRFIPVNPGAAATPPAQQGSGGGSPILNLLMKTGIKTGTSALTNALQPAVTSTFGETIGAALPGIGSIAASLPSLISSWTDSSMKGGEKALSTIGNAATIAATIAGMGYLAPFIQGATSAIMQQLQPSSAWRSFGDRIGDVGRSVSGGLGILEQALPDVQTQEELSGLLDTYKRYVRGERAHPERASNEPGALDDEPWLSYGGADPDYGVGTEWWDLGGLPAAGGSAHEGGYRYNFDRRVEPLQAQIDALRASLPGTATASPLSGEALERLWTPYYEELPLVQRARKYLAAEPAFGSYLGTDMGYAPAPATAETEEQRALRQLMAAAP